MSTVLSCTALDAGYVGRPCVRGFDLELQVGEVLALLGPNGAGKTTTLMTLAGLLPCLGGEVCIDGHPVKPGHARSAVKAGLVLVPDDRSLFTTLTVEENLRLSVRARRGWRTERDTVLETFPQLADRLKVPAGALSGGEQQMLAIGRALVQHPKVLLIDELSMGLAPGDRGTSTAGRTRGRRQDRRRGRTRRTARSVGSRGRRHRDRRTARSAGAEGQGRRSRRGSGARRERIPVGGVRLLVSPSSMPGQAVAVSGTPAFSGHE